MIAASIRLVIQSLTSPVPIWARKTLQVVHCFDGSPVLDIKDYILILEPVNGAVIPEWLDWGFDCIPEEGLDLFEEMEE